MTGSARLLKIAAVCICTIARGSAAQRPILQVSPRDALMDAPLEITVSGVTPADTVTVSVTAVDGNGVRWTSHAAYVVPTSGVVTPRLQAPVRGSYRGREPMGLVWSMHPPAGVAAPFTMPPALKPFTLQFEAFVAGRRIGVATVVRRAVAATVSRVPVQTDSLVGIRFIPAGPDPHPGVVVLGGSEGGEDEQTAALLASHGFATFAAAYFDAPGLSRSLVRVPIEIVDRALHFLGHQAGVDSTRLALVGTSRGGELALLAASHFGEARAVVGIVPSAVVEAGLEFGKGPVPVSAWTYKGKDVPFMRFADWVTFARTGAGWTRIAPAVIPVERIRGPILLISGDDDQLGFSSPLSRIGVARLRQHGHPYADEWLHYADAGHLIGIPFVPTANLRVLKTPYGALNFGGTAIGYARADERSWPVLLHFLATAPGTRGPRRDITGSSR